MKFKYHNGDKPLPGYTIRRAIGRGGFGEVYYAVSDAGKEVALKAINQHQDIELRGVRHCMNLKCPNLVAVYDVREGDGANVFVLMEYVAGESLSRLLKERGGPLAADVTLGLVKQVAAALDYLHGHGIVHRDLKPSNVFIEDGVAKIGDYGLAKFIAVSDHEHTMNVGSVHYMAPEVGSGSYGRSIDVYALGAMLYEMAAGHVPFDGSSAAEILMKHLTEEPDLAGVPEPMRPVVAKALAKDPDKRYETAGQLVAALEAALAGRPPEPAVAPRRRIAQPGMSDMSTIVRPSSAEQQPTRQAGRAKRPRREMAFGHRLFLAGIALAAFHLVAAAVAPGLARTHLPDMTLYVAVAAAGVTVAGLSLRLAGVMQPLTSRFYSLVLGLAAVYGFQRFGAYGVLGHIASPPLPSTLFGRILGVGASLAISPRDWLVYFTVLLIAVDWHSRTAPGRRKAVSKLRTIAAAFVGGVAGMFLNVGLLPGAYAAGAMSFIVELLTHGPVFAQPARAAPAWLTRARWAAKAVAAAALAGAVFYVWSPVAGVHSSTLRPMAFVVCVGLMWYCIARFFGPQAGDMWTAGGQPALLAGAITAGGFAAAAGINDAASLQLLGAVVAAFCACAALWVKWLPSQAPRSDYRLPLAHAGLWLMGIVAFALFALAPSVFLSLQLSPAIPMAVQTAAWLAGAGLLGFGMLLRWRRLSLPGVLSALTFACLAATAFALGHYLCNGRVGAGQGWALAGAAGAAALMLLWPSARHDAPQARQREGGER